MKALIIIDIQKGYIEKYDKNLLARINQRIENAKSDSELVVYIRNIKKLRSGDKIADLADELLLISNYVFCKAQADAFANRKFISFLEQNKVVQVELVGVDGNSCIEKSAVGADKLGYQVFLRKECIGVQNAVRFEKTKQKLKERGIAII